MHRNDVQKRNLKTDADVTDNASLPVNGRHRYSQAVQCNLAHNLKHSPDDFSDEDEQHKPNKVTHDWQSSKACIRERIEFMFNNEFLADIYFIVGKGTKTQRIPAHKFVLSVGSAVFDAMFNRGLATQSKEIELPDVEPAAFFALLRFLYSDCVQIGPETVMTTLYTAKKYDVPALEKKCVKFLEHNLSSDNAFMLLTQARIFDEAELAARCLKTIDEYTADAVAAEGFDDIDLETLSCVLSRDSLHIKEVKLFEAVVKWAEVKCQHEEIAVTPENQRLVLGNALKLIRFPLMSIEDFASTVAQSGLLTSEETVSIFLHFTVTPKPSIEFINTSRSIMSGNELRVNRFQQTEMRWGYSGTCDRIRFTVDHTIYVVGFGLYGSIHSPAEYTASIQILQAANRKVLGSNDTSYSSDGSASIFRVIFEEPIQITRNTSYIASATIQGPDSHYGTKGTRKVAVDSPNGEITFQFCYSNGNNNGSSIDDGQIPQILFHV